MRPRNENGTPKTTLRTISSTTKRAIGVIDSLEQAEDRERVVSALVNLYLAHGAVRET